VNARSLKHRIWRKDAANFQIFYCGERRMEGA